MARSRSRSSRTTRPSRPADAPEFPAESALLALSVSAVRPSPQVKQRLLARVTADAAARAATAAAAPTPPAWRFDGVNRAEGWLTMPFPGVKMKELSLDDARNTALVLMEMAPRSRFPDHEHEFSDEGIVLSGDVTTGGRVLRAGDYYYGPAGAKHEDISTVKGCTALVHMAATAWRHLRTRGQPASRAKA